MSLWHWERTELENVWQGTHRVSGAIISVRETQSNDKREEWIYAIPLQRGEATAWLYSLCEGIAPFWNAEGAIQAAEALFDAEGNLLDREAVFRRAFGAKLQFLSTAEQVESLPSI